MLASRGGALHEESCNINPAGLQLPAKLRQFTCREGDNSYFQAGNDNMNGYLLSQRVESSGSFIGMRSWQKLDWIGLKNRLPE